MTDELNLAAIRARLAMNYYTAGSENDLRRCLDIIERQRADNARLTDRLVALNGEYDVITGALALSDEKQEAMRPVVEAARAFVKHPFDPNLATSLGVAVLTYEAQQGEKPNE